MARLSLNTRRGLARARERAPFEPWSRLARRLEAEIEPGQHVTVVGPTGAGKTTLLLEIADMLPDVVFIATKRRDALIADLRRRGWVVVRSAKELRRPRRRSFFDSYFGGAAPSLRLVFWPRPGSTIKATRAAQAAQVGALLDWAHARGRVALAIDEALFVSRNLRLAEELEVVLHEGRSSGISLLAASQRPAWLPPSFFAAPEYLGMFRTTLAGDLKRLNDLGGSLDPKALGYELRRLERHEFALVEPRRQPPRVTRSRVDVD